MCERKDVNVSLNDSNSIKSKDINTGLIDVLGAFYSLLGHFLKWLHETQLRKHTVIVEKKSYSEFYVKSTMNNPKYKKPTKGIHEKINILIHESEGRLMNGDLVGCVNDVHHQNVIMSSQIDTTI